MNNKPNLFSYATKELSQDAMICWLLKWSEAGNSDDRELHECGVRFASALLDKHDKTLDGNRIEEVEIHQQEKNIDVLVRIRISSIESKYVLLIEDKTGTKDHDQQLERYLDIVKAGKTKLREVKEEVLCPIYLKTGNQPLCDDQRIEKHTEYKLFKRCDFLEVLECYRGNNAILTDFRRHLRDLQKRTESYQEWTREEWTHKDTDEYTGKYWYWNAWEGLFGHLENHLGTYSSWGYVPLGDFLGYWWWPTGNDELYLQIECSRKGKGGWRNARLCFRVSAKTQDRRRELRRSWHRRVMEAGGELVEKPDRMKAGKTMTVAVWKGDWLAFDKNGKLNKEDTVSNLEQVAEVLENAINLPDGT